MPSWMPTMPEWTPAKHMSKSTREQTQTSHLCFLDETTDWGCAANDGFVSFMF